MLNSLQQVIYNSGYEVSTIL